MDSQQKNASGDFFVDELFYAAEIEPEPLNNGDWKWPSATEIASDHALYVGNDPVNAVDPLGLDAYLFFTYEGPSDAPVLGHVGIGVDEKGGGGGVIRRDPSYGSTRYLKRSPSLMRAFNSGDAFGIVIPNHRLPDGRMSDDVVRDSITPDENRNGTIPYTTFCGNYANNVLDGIGYSTNTVIPVIMVLRLQRDEYIGYDNNVYMDPVVGTPPKTPIKVYDRNLHPDPQVIQNPRNK